jgi:hypothetical protein
VRLFLPPFLWANFCFSLSLRRKSDSVYWAALEGVQTDGLVEWMRVTSNPIRDKWDRQEPGSREWSSLIDRSKGWRRGRGLTMLWILDSTWVVLSMSLVIGRIRWNTLTGIQLWSQIWDHFGHKLPCQHHNFLTIRS